MNRWKGNAVTQITLDEDFIVPDTLEDNVTAVGIPARPVKKDGVTLPKRKETMTLEEYETMKERMLQMEEEIRQLKEKLNKQ